MTWTAAARQSRFDRWSTRILGAADGRFGDERERVRYHESSTITMLVQVALLPWALAAMIWFAPGRAAPYLALAYLCFAFPFILGQIYRARRSAMVHAGPPATAVGSLTTVFLWLPGLLIGTGLAAGWDAPAESPAMANPTTLWAVVVAAVVGGAAYLALLTLFGRFRGRAVAHRADEAYADDDRAT